MKIRLDDLLDIHKPVLMDEKIYIRDIQTYELLESLSKFERGKYGKCNVHMISEDPEYKGIALYVLVDE